MIRVSPRWLRPRVPQPTEWQRIGNEINAPFIFAWADFVNVHGMLQRLASDIVDSKKVDVRQRLSIRMRMKKHFILFCVTLIAVAPVCFAQPSPAKPAKSASNQT